MKILSMITKAYCIAAGLLLGPLLVGSLIAYFSGMLPEQPLQRIVQALEKDSEADADSEGEGAADESTDTDQDRSATDERAWARRLEHVGDGIISNLKNVEDARLRVAKEEAALDGLVQAVTELLSTLLGKPVQKQDLYSSSDELVAQLREVGKGEKRMPWMLDTLKSMKPRAVAALFGTAGSEEEGGLKDDEAVKLLGGLQPRKAGEVLAELGKVDPGQASRLLALLGKEELQSTGE